MKKIQDGAAFIFIVAVAILSLVSILGIWDFLAGDVISKSFQTLGLLMGVTVVVLIASQFIEGRSQTSGMAITELPNPLFKSMRQLTLTLLIASCAILALLGVLSIWNVISDKNILYKSASSLAQLAFSSFLIVMACLNQEGSLTKTEDGKPRNISGGYIIAFLFFAYLIFYIFSSFYRYY